jgi:hypothetical protein
MAFRHRIASSFRGDQDALAQSSFAFGNGCVLRRSRFPGQNKKNVFFLSVLDSGLKDDDQDAQLRRPSSVLRCLQIPGSAVGLHDTSETTLALWAGTRDFWCEVARRRRKVITTYSNCLLARCSKC